MNEYKYQQRQKKRGDNCCFAYVDDKGIPHSVLCGCGYRCPPTKKYKRRIIRRELVNQLRKYLEDGTVGNWQTTQA